MAKSTLGDAMNKMEAQSEQSIVSIAVQILAVIAGVAAMTYFGLKGA